MIYPEQESKVLEFKSKLPKNFNALIKTCVAFANTAGGKIVIGVEDETRKIVGISDVDRDRMYFDFPNSLYDATAPGLFAHIYEKSMGNKTVLNVEISYSAKKPVYVKVEGMPKGVYIRVGASNRRAQESHVRELVREGRHDYFDEEPTKARLEDLSTLLLSGCYGKSYTEKKLLADFVITNSINVKQYHATVAGMLMFCDSPEKYIPEALVICTQFSGTKGRDIVQTRELTGPIPQLIEDALTLLRNWLERNLTLQGAKLKGNSLIPPKALREALVNALLHRKYSVEGAVKIALYDDRMEIFSPGAFPGLIDIQNLGDGTTCLRNPHLTQLARRFHLIEKLGTGIRLIFDECRQKGLRKPSFKEDGDFVKVVFYFSPDLSKEDASSAILDLLKNRAVISISDVMMLLNVSRNTASRRLNVLIDKGLVVRSGKGPSVRYLLAAE